MGESIVQTKRFDVTAKHFFEVLDGLVFGFALAVGGEIRKSGGEAAVSRVGDGCNSVEHLTLRYKVAFLAFFDVTVPIGSIPKELFVVRDAVAIQKSAELFLKRFHAVMLCLVADIRFGLVAIGRADGKHAVAALPVEAGVFWS